MNTTPSVHFAHVTDIHISDQGDSWGALGGQAPRLLAACCERLNAVDDLDFVLITGDVLDRSTPVEVERFRDAIAVLHKPWHFVPGNHDGFYDPNHPDAYTPREAVELIDPRMADPEPDAQKAHWSRAVRPGVRLIGLDSRMGDDWGGVIDEAQFAWLKGELETHRGDLVIVGVHHPLRNLIPRNEKPWWSNFICDNGAQVEGLLDQYPDARLVLSGHHHANHIRRHNGRLHVVTAALSGYPCSYRTIRMTAQGSGWHTRIETHTVADDATLAGAYTMLLESNVAERYDADNPSRWVEFCVGRPGDRAFDGLLG